MRISDAERNTIPHIDDIYAFLSVDPETGNEGICAMTVPVLGNMPMVTGKAANAEAMKPVAKQIAEDSGCAIRLVKFHSREDIESILPF